MRTPKQILEQTNELAAMFYKCQGYKSPKGFRFDKSNHGHEQIAWAQACIAQEELTGTDLEDVLIELEDETSELGGDVLKQKEFKND